MKRLKAIVLACALATSTIVPVAVAVANPVCVEAATNIQIDWTQMNLKKGVSQKITLYKNGKALTSGVKWKSSNSKVVAVDQKGKVTAKKYGLATVTATYKGKKYTCKIAAWQDEKSKIEKYDFKDATFDGTTWAVNVVKLDANPYDAKMKAGYFSRTQLKTGNFGELGSSLYSLSNQTLSFKDGVASLKIGKEVVTEGEYNIQKYDGANVVTINDMLVCSYNTAGQVYLYDDEMGVTYYFKLQK